MEALPIWAWVAFLGFIVLMLTLDLGVFHRKAHVVTPREALPWVTVWVALALGFNALIFFWRGPQPALEFFTGYLIELTLSVDNVFVFIIIFGYFKVPAEFQHKVLFWGIVGAAAMRALFIFAGLALINRFEWVIAIFGAFLIYTGIKMLLAYFLYFHFEITHSLAFIAGVLVVSVLFSVLTPKGDDTNPPVP